MSGKGFTFISRKRKLKSGPYISILKDKRIVSAHRACTFTHAHIKFLKETLMLALMSLTLVFKAIISASCF